MVKLFMELIRAPGPKMKKVNLPLFYWNVLTLATESQGEKMSSVLLSHTC